MSLKLTRALLANAVLLAVSLPAFAVSVTPALSSEAALAIPAHVSATGVDKLAAIAESADQVAFHVSILKHERHPKGAVSLESEFSLVTPVGKPVSYFSGSTFSYLSSVTTKEVDPTERETAAAADVLDAALNDAFGDKVQGGSAEQVASSSAFDTAAAQASVISTTGGAEGGCASSIFGGGSEVSMTTDTLQVGDRIAVTPLAVNKDGSIEAQVDFKRSSLQSMNNVASAEGEPDVQLPQVFSQGGQQEVRLVPGKTATLHLQAVDLMISGHVLKSE